MVLTQSPRFSSVPRFHERERLYESKFVLSGFILHFLATEKELRETFEAAFIDKFAFTPHENRFEFVRAVEKKIVKIRSTDGITGEVFKHFCGSLGLIYIRSTTDLTVLLTNNGNLLKQEADCYYPTLDELEELFDESMEEHCVKCSNKQLFLVQMWENTDQKKLRIWTHFTQWKLLL